MLAEAHGNVEQIDEGLTMLAEALAGMDKTGERYWEAELYRLKGELLLRQALPDEHQAETCFQQARPHRRPPPAGQVLGATGGHEPESPSWQRQGETRRSARQVLAEVYGWFTEGFDTADLQEAKALLEELWGIMAHSLLCTPFARPLCSLADTPGMGYHTSPSGSHHHASPPAVG